MCRSSVKRRNNQWSSLMLCSNDGFRFEPVWAYAPGPLQIEVKQSSSEKTIA